MKQFSGNPQIGCRNRQKFASIGAPGLDNPIFKVSESTFLVDQPNF
jgi:hypothetical protein